MSPSLRREFNGPKHLPSSGVPGDRFVKIIVCSPVSNIMRSMKLIFTAIAFVLIASLSISAQTGDKAVATAYDAELAKRLGGDDNGMKNYVLVILKTGPKDGEFKDKARLDMFAGHMANINRLADEGKLAVAGPFVKNDRQYRGLYIFNVKTVEEAQKLVETDPVVKAGILIAEMTPWYGSASLMATNELHKKITKPTK